MYFFDMKYIKFFVSSSRCDYHVPMYFSNEDIKRYLELHGINGPYVIQDYNIELSEYSAIHFKDYEKYSKFLFCASFHFTKENL